MELGVFQDDEGMFAVRAERISCGVLAILAFAIGLCQQCSPSHVLEILLYLN